jgi:hypothetical protein
VLPLDPAMRALHTDRLGTFPADVNLTPHFPTSAALIREMYRLRTGTTVDGVLSADPIGLSYLLRATGPVRMPAGPALAAETAVRALLVDAYAQRTGAGLSEVGEKERYFSEAARAVFETVSRGVARPGEALASLARAAGERRLLLWSARPAEQKAIEGTMLEGALPLDDGARPTVGVFLNDASGAKLSYYLAGEASLTSAGCLADGRRTLRLRMTIGSDAPASGLPAYVLGLGLSGDPYTVRTQVLVYSPTEGGVVDVRLDGAAAPFGAGTERRRSVGVLLVDLRPGQRRTVEVTLLTGAAPGSEAVDALPQLWVTPGVRPWTVTTDKGKKCGIRQ